MVNKIKNALTSPVFWIAFIVGAVAALAFPAVRKIAQPIASKLPGASA